MLLNFDLINVVLSKMVKKARAYRLNWYSRSEYIVDMRAAKTNEKQKKKHKSSDPLRKNYHGRRPWSCSFCYYYTYFCFVVVIALFRLQPKCNVGLLYSAVWRSTNDNKIWLQWLFFILACLRSLVFFSFVRTHFIILSMNLLRFQFVFFSYS